jgi:hypothetical protein
MSRSRAGWLAIAAGLALALGAQLAAPVGVPLYDGVPVQEPYRFLAPVGDQLGDPTSFSSTEDVVGGAAPVLIAATLEAPPQAQLVAQRDAFQVPSGVTAIKVAITPVEPPAPPPEGARIAGNVYRFSITDQSDRPLAAKPCEACRTIVLRAPEGTGDGTVMRFEGGRWEGLRTAHAGTVAMYQSNITLAGDYAVVAGPGVAGPPGVGGGAIDLTLLLLGGGIALVFAAFIGLMFLRSRPPRLTLELPRRGSAGEADRRSLPGRVPSKRKGSKRPPSGRSDE